MPDFEQQDSSNGAGGYKATESSNAQRASGERYHPRGHRGNSDSSGINREQGDQATWKRRLAAQRGGLGSSPTFLIAAVIGIVLVVAGGVGLYLVTGPDSSQTGETATADKTGGEEKQSKQNQDRNEQGEEAAAEQESASRAGNATGENIRSADEGESKPVSIDGARTAPIPKPLPNPSGRDYSLSAYNKNGQRKFVNPENPPADHPRHPGPVIAMSWKHDTLTKTDKNSPEDFKYLGYNYFGTGLSSDKHLGNNLPERLPKIDKIVEWLGKWPEGRRGLTLWNMSKMYSNSFGKRDHRDAPIITTFGERIRGEKRDTIKIRPAPFKMDKGQTVAVIHSYEVPYNREKQISGPFRLTEPTPKGGTEVHMNKTIKINGKKGDPLVNVGANSFWMYNTIRDTRMYINQLMKALKEEGLTLDYMILDAEFTMVPDKGWARKYNKNDPRWTLPEHGFAGQSVEEVLENGEFGEKHGIGLNRFEALGGMVKDWSMHAGLFAPAKRHFPDLKGSDWRSIGYRDNELAQGVKPGGHTPSQFGTHGNYDLYSVGGPKGFDQVLTSTKFLRALWRMTGGRVQPWIPFKSQNKTINNFYYGELIRHIALHEPDPMLYFQWRGDSWTPEQDVHLEEILTDVNNQLDGGFSLMTTYDPHKQEITAEPFDKAKETVTGVKLEDRSALWRITCRRYPRADKRKDWMPPEDQPVEVTVKKKGSGDVIDTVTIPGGKAGTWWRHNEATTELSFHFEYPER